MSELYIGLDPGKSGAIAWCGPGLRDAGYIKLDGTDRDIWETLRRLSREHQCVAMIERVNAMPGGGERRMGATSAFTFGRSFGFLHGILTASEIPYAEITPPAWQKILGLNKKFPSQKERKNAHKQKAQQLFPTSKIIHANADALLLAAVAVRMETPVTRLYEHTTEN